MNNKLDEFLDGLKLGELLHRNEIEAQKNKNCALKSCLITISILIVIVAVAIAAYKIISDKIDDYDEFDDDFDDDFIFDDEDDDSVSATVETVDLSSKDED